MPITPVRNTAKSSGPLKISTLQRVSGTPEAPVTAPSGAPSPGPSGGGKGGGGGGVGGWGGISLPHWMQFKIPSWYHGIFPASKLANTIRDLEFSFLGDLSQWNYNAQQFNGCSMLIAFGVPPNINIPDGTKVSVDITDANSNDIGTNGGVDVFSSSVAIDATGKYNLSSAYTISVQIVNFSVYPYIDYIFPDFVLTGAVLKAGASFTLTIDAASWAAQQPNVGGKIHHQKES